MEQRRRHAGTSWDPTLTRVAQAEQLLGMPADDLAPLKETEGQAEFKEVLKRAQWTQWTMRIRTQTRYGALQDFEL